ncbi:MAG: peptidase M15A [Alcanivorax sp.]|nr:peptidase M15A [Alcanivorax sp.]
MWVMRCVLVWCLTMPFWAVAAADFDAGHAPFSINVSGKDIAYRDFVRLAMPGEQVIVRVPAAESGRTSFTLLLDGQPQPARSPGLWRWRVPERPGVQQLRVRRADGEQVQVHVFIMRPLNDVNGQYLNGYRVGSYPASPLHGNPVYLPPAGFIEVTEEMLDIRLSPHFTLGQFLCKQQADAWPKYMALREPLLVKLELLLEEVNRRGIRTESFVVMSGFRTPWYNANIGNGTYSRHIWGGAADIYIDTNGSGRMDDLNGDGKLDMADAQVLHDIAESLFAEPLFSRLSGGLGLYGARAHRGAFLHVDARGHEARWAIP